MVDPVDEYPMQLLKVFDGKKLNPTTTKLIVSDTESFS